MRHAYHVPGPAQYYLRRAAIVPGPANVTGGAARDALVIRHGHVMTMDPQLGDIPPDDIYQGTRLACAEAIGSGLTTVHDWCHNVRGQAHAEASLRALAESGLRGRFS
jgi:cytosine/adenosine deaminase-related metal-dependent hydrolase